MNWHKGTIQVVTRGKGLYPFTGDVSDFIRQSGVEEGMCFLYVQHTSASLVISESYDPSARQDLENYMEKAAPEIRKIYNMYDVPDKMRIAYPNAEHDFPQEVREESYRFLDRFLMKESSAGK